MSELSDAQKWANRFLNKVEKERRENKMSSKIITAVQKVNIKDLLARAGWTFVQAFLAVFLFTSESIIDLLFLGDWTGLYGLLVTTVVAATAAGLSAIKTVLVQVIKEIKAKAE